MKKIVATISGIRSRIRGTGRALVKSPRAFPQVDILAGSRPIKSRSRRNYQPPLRHEIRLTAEGWRVRRGGTDGGCNTSNSRGPRCFDGSPQDGDASRGRKCFDPCAKDQGRIGQSWKEREAAVSRIQRLRPPFSAVPPNRRSTTFLCPVVTIPSRRVVTQRDGPAFKWTRVRCNRREQCRRRAGCRAIARDDGRRAVIRDHRRISKRISKGLFTERYRAEQIRMYVVA